MVLSAIMKLDAGGFTTPLGKATQSVQTVVRLMSDLGGKMQAAFDTGGMLSDLQARTGELPGTLMTLRQAFEDTGVGADKTGQILAIMRRNMAQLNDDGSMTNKMFERLGINVDDLKNMSATDQLAVIGERIRGLKTPAEQSAAAMEIFGRSGSSMLTLLKDDKALATASASLGELPELMNRNASAFDGISDALGRIKNKGAGLWAGIAEGALPAANSITASLDGIDLTGIGMRIGTFIGTTVELFRSAPIGQLLRDSIVVGLGSTVNSFSTFFATISQAFWRALATPLSYLSASFGKTIQEIMELIGKIPKIGEKLGLSGFEAQSFVDLQDQAKSDILDIFDFDPNITLIDTADEKARLKEVGAFAGDQYKTRLAAVQAAANAAMASAGTGTAGFNMIGAAGGGAAGGGGAGIGIATDALARIGGFTGGGSRMETLAERQLALARDQLNTLIGIRDKTGGARWATV